MAESTSSFHVSYRITYQLCLDLVWLQSYDNMLVLAAILDLFPFVSLNMTKDENSTPWASAEKNAGVGNVILNQRFSQRAVQPCFARQVF